MEYGFGRRGAIRAVALDSRRSPLNLSLAWLAQGPGRAIMLAAALLDGSIVASCSDDAGRTGDTASGVTGGSGNQNAGGRGVVGGGGAGGHGSDGTGGMPWNDDCFEPGWGGLPISRDDEDRCLVCLAENCCDALYNSGGVISLHDDAGLAHESFYGYEERFSCVRTCFERDAARDQSTHSQTILDACSNECAPRDLTDAAVTAPSERDLLACASGGPRPIPNNADGGGKPSEVDADGDAGGKAPNCIAECFPNWR
jgi:hypothetical protein